MSDIYSKYETVVGLEVHVQLATVSKAFCADGVQFGAAPNTQTSVISLAHPGTLPRVNKQQIEFALRLGLALGSEINRKNYFDRKNYFYADLPKGYQITQDRVPICKGGSLVLETSGGSRTLRIHHIHMEEDAGKSIHDQSPDSSFIDLNRAGTPLLEIVTEPDLRSGEEVEVLMNTLRHLVRWLGISDGNMEEGSMRCDVNISVRLKGAAEFGTRCEVKNVNSMRFARRAIEFETKRQIDLLENGGTIVQNTLNFDPATGTTSPLRSKENAHDYRYFPDPDLPPVVVSEALLEKVKTALPALPDSVRHKFATVFQMPAEQVQLLTEERNLAEFTDKFLHNFVGQAANSASGIRSACNLLVQKILPYCAENNIEIADFPLEIEQIMGFLALIDSNKISNSTAYQVLFPKLLEAERHTDPSVLASDLNLFQNDDADFLKDLVATVVLNYPEKVLEYKKGKKGLLGFFVGEVMKASKGKAEPKSTNALVMKALE
jgi:aspartyl-tRNA(Asn)/glutamyl-tRNA(Gln) amidotransferase subunit B